MKTSSALRKWGLFLVLVPALSCGSSNPLSVPNVAGTWNTLTSNTDTTRLFNCHGQVVPFWALQLEGLTWDDVSGPGGAGSSGIQFLATQAGTQLSLAPTTVGGVTYTGGGTVDSTGNTVGYVDWVDPFTGFSLRAFFTGPVSGTSITLQISLVENDGGTEDCTVRPPLEVDVTVS